MWKRFFVPQAIRTPQPQQFARPVVEELEPRQVLAVAGPTTMTAAALAAAQVQPAQMQQANVPPTNQTTTNQGSATQTHGTNQAPITSAQLAAVLVNPGTPTPGTQAFFQPQATQALAPNTTSAILTQGQVQQPGNLDQYQPDVLLARLGFVGLAQNVPNARFSMPRLLAGGGDETYINPADREVVDRIRSVILVEAPQQDTDDMPESTAVTEQASPTDSPEQILLLDN